MILGGHAIMLSVDLPDEIKAARDQWIAASPSRKAVANPHITLLFLGRDLEEWVGDAMVDVVDELELEMLLPFEAQSTGRFEMFGMLGESMVMTMKDGPLTVTREKLKDIFDEKFGIRPDGSFHNFRPHISLAEGATGDPPPVTRVPPMLIPFKQLQAKIGSARTHSRTIG